MRDRQPSFDVYMRESVQKITPSVKEKSLGPVPAVHFIISFFSFHNLT
jgi:hypothetical protein